MVWVKQTVNNQIQTLPSNFVRRSKETLLFLRKPGAIELRHQRNPDVVLDFERTPLEVPEDIFITLETLLPEARYNEQTKKGGFLQLLKKFSLSIF